MTPKKIKYKFKNPEKVNQIKHSLRGPRPKGYVNDWGHWRTAPVICGLIEQYKIKSFVEMGACGCQLSEIVLVEFPYIDVCAVDITFGPNANRAGTLTVAPIDKMRKEYGPRFRAIEKPSLEACKDFADQSLDMVYIDAGHLLPQIKADIAAWLPKVRTGGIISGHDYGHGQNPGVARAVSAAFKQFYVSDYYNWWKIVTR